jgi:putative transposase
MIYPVVRELAAQHLPAATCCRLLGVSTSGFYEWRNRTPSVRARADAELTTSIAETHRISRGTYGASRLHAELHLGCGVQIGRKRVARLIRNAGLVGSTGAAPRDPPAGTRPPIRDRTW